MTQVVPQPAIELAAQSDLTETERHQLLSSERRRRILAFLTDLSRSISCEELARKLAIAETGTTDPAEATVREITISLHHSHLPALDDLGIVDYDATTNLVEPTTN